MNDESCVRIVIHPHARERMEEKGATEEEIRRVVREGKLSPARYGRMSEISSMSRTACLALDDSFIDRDPPFVLNQS